jgi:hypothetical protein
MSEPTYQIVFRGKILSGHTRDEVRSRLAALFRTEPARIDALLDAPKTILKTGLSKDAALRYQEALRQAGIMVAAVAESVPVAPVVAAPARPPSTPPTAASPSVPTSQGVPAAIGTDPAVAASAGDGLTLAAPGERIVSEPAPPRRAFDLSRLSLAEPGAVLSSHAPARPPPLTIDHLSLAADEGPIDPTPRPPPRDIDTSALSLSARPPETEKPLTTLQKLLASDPGS